MFFRDSEFDVLTTREEVDPRLSVRLSRGESREVARTSKKIYRMPKDNYKSKLLRCNL